MLVMKGLLGFLPSVLDPHSRLLQTIHTPHHCISGSSIQVFRSNIWPLATAITPNTAIFPNISHLKLFKVDFLRERTIRPPIPGPRQTCRMSRQEETSNAISTNGRIKQLNELDRVGIPRSSAIDSTQLTI